MAPVHERTVSRITGLAGILTFVGILGGEVIAPGMIAGERVSGTIDEAAIRAYYGHAALGPLAIIGFLIAATALVFFAGLSEDLRTRGGNAFFARLGLYFGLANIPIYLLTAAFGATLVTLATTGAPVLATFRLWDLFYNSGAYAFEIGFLLFFSLAMRGANGWPRWIAALGLAAAAAQSFNFLALWTSAPDAATIPGNLLLAAFLASASVNVLRRREARSPHAVAEGERADAA